MRTIFLSGMVARRSVIPPRISGFQFAFASGRSMSFTRRGRSALQAAIGLRLHLPQTAKAITDARVELARELDQAVDVLEVLVEDVKAVATLVLHLLDDRRLPDPPFRAEDEALPLEDAPVAVDDRVTPHDVFRREASPRIDLHELVHTPLSTNVNNHVRRARRASPTWTEASRSARKPAVPGRAADRNPHLAVRIDG